MNIFKEVSDVSKRAKEASRILAGISGNVRNRALIAMADAVEKNMSEILDKNSIDMKAAEKSGLSKALIDRLNLTENRIRSMADGLRDITKLPDPVGEVLEEVKRPNGLLIRKVRVPLGVIGIIYESRPNVTGDSAGLCLKSGNSVVLRGGSESINSNMAIVSIIEKAAYGAGIPEGAIGLIRTTDREAVAGMSRLDKLLDMIILRGSEKMIDSITRNATVPVMRHGRGLCHTYVDASADPGKAEKICINAKVQRPGVCNAMETLLVHKDVAGRLLPGLVKKMQAAGVEVRGDDKTAEIAAGIRKANEEDWSTEYLDLILSVKVVDNYDEAIGHILSYGSGHSDAIVTEDRGRAEEFLKRVDSASVYWNASTRFTDGSQFGMGSEIGISTQKIHARGPMGIKDLTSTKYMIYGDGQVRE